VRPLILCACLVLLAAACGATTPSPDPSPTGSPTPAVTPGPTAEPTPLRWTNHVSQRRQFSLQLPSVWEIEPGIPAEGILLQVDAGADGWMVMIEEDRPQAGQTFRDFARQYFEGAFEGNAGEVEFIRFGDINAARAAVRVGTSETVQYLYEPVRATTKILSFGWEHATPNPLWEMVAQRFNPHSTQLIIPFGTPAPGG
jgi:hypothetical protein